MQVSEESSFKVQIEAMKTYNDVCGIKMGKYPSRDTATYTCFLNRTSTRFRIMQRGWQRYNITFQNNIQISICNMALQQDKCIFKIFSPLIFIAHKNGMRVLEWHVTESRENSIYRLQKQHFIWQQKLAWKLFCNIWIMLMSTRR